MMRADALCPALGKLIAAVGQPGFGMAAFELARQELGADHLVVNLIGRTEVRGLFTKGRIAARIADTLNQRYLERYYLLDKSLLAFWDLACDDPVAVRFDPNLNASSVYNAFFFERAGLCDKISLIGRRDDRLLCCNIYRLQGTGPFTGADFQRAQALALLLTSAVWLHVEKTVLPQASIDDFTGASEQVGREALQSLSKREMEVCRRLLVGASNEGVALDLAISAHTVRTLRKRIYKKLQVSSLTDLFSKYRNVMSTTSLGP